MSLDISDRARKLWDEWNLRVAVLISLLFQIVLIFSANSRRRKGGILLTAIIWSSYLLADWIAAFAVGLISSGQTSNCPKKTAVNNELAAFWAPFLLLHLGGPDDITAFSLEDNELWIRHLLGLLIQVVAVVYVFVQSLPNEYWIPTALLFFAGVCKYAERTLSFYKACLGNFKTSLLPKPDSGPNYAQLMEEFSALEASHVPVKIDIVRETAKANNGERIIPSSEAESLDYLDIVFKGYHFFDVFKGLVVDHMFSFHERDESRFFFFKRTAADAFRVMEVELNFLYDVLFTKMGLVHCKIGYLCRLLATALLAACFQQFASHPHHHINHFDKIVTYVLLVGAVALDLVGMFKLVFSDWVIVSAKEKVARVLIRLPFSRREQRWSDSMAQHGFISFCLNEEQRFKWLNKIAGYFRMKEVLDEFRYKKRKACGEKLKELVFNELKAKAMNAKSTKMAKEIYSARGDNVLSDYPSHYSYPSISDSLSDETEYDESLLLWHIATELCYFTRSIPEEDEATEAELNKKARIEMCKALSDYMLYLLIMQRTLMSTVSGIAQIRFQDTCKEANKFFKRWQSEIKTDEQACEKLLAVKKVKNLKANEVKGDRSKSLLFDACILANDLKEMEKNEERRWEMMSKVWVELLSYGASHCRASDHARQLSRGGEFITFVWLLMVHFGLGEQFRIEAGHARAKLLVEFGSGIIPYLSNALQDAGARVPYMSVLPKSASNDSISKELDKMRTMPTRVFVVHVSQSLGSNLFQEVSRLGMMSEGYVWIVTSEVMDLSLFANSDDDVEAMLGVVGVRPLIPDSERLKSFNARWIKPFNQGVERAWISVFGIWAYDTLWALAMAAERVGNNASSFAVGVSETGPKLHKALLETRFTGLAGEFNLINGELGQTAYQIFNILGSYKRHVGTWAPSKEENMSSEVNLTKIVWPGDARRPPKGWEFPADGSELSIAVPLKPGFDELLKVEINSTTNETNVTGHYKNVFDAIMKKLPYTIPHKFKAYPLLDPNGSVARTYDDLMHQVSLQTEYGGALGDFTVTATRSRYVDFTVPYAEGGVACIVPMKQEMAADAWTF